MIRLSGTANSFVDAAHIARMSSELIWQVKEESWAVAAATTPTLQGCTHAYFYVVFEGASQHRARHYQFCAPSEFD